MRVLIIGGAGFVGTHLRAKLGQKHEVVIFDKERIDPAPDNCKYVRGDITDYLSIASVFHDFKPQQVYHLAGMVSRRECEETPTLAFQVNVVGTYHVCTLCVKHGARLIYAGSSEEYGRGFDNATITEGSSFGPATGIYSLTKRVAEQIIQHYAHSKGLKAVITRFFMLYGPGEPSCDYRSAVIRFIDCALTGRPMPVHLGTSRSWCYISDAVEALELILNWQQDGPWETFNIGRAEQIETVSLARIIRDMTGTGYGWVEVPVEPTIIPHKVADFSHIKDVLGWEAKTPLKVGLSIVIKSEEKRRRA